MAASPLCPLMTKVRFSCPACAKAHSDAVRITRKSEQVCHILPLIRNLLLDFKTAAILHAFRCSHVSHSSYKRGSYKRGCQEKNLPPAPRRDAGVVICIQPRLVSSRGCWFGRFGSPRIPAAMPTPVACPNSTVS